MRIKKKDQGNNRIYYYGCVSSFLAFFHVNVLQWRRAEKIYEKYSERCDKEIRPGKKFQYNSRWKATIQQEAETVNSHEV